MPPTRGLAQSLGVSRDTVEAAYSQLHAEGFIVRRVGSGSFVAEINKFEHKPKRVRSARLYPQKGKDISSRGYEIWDGGGVRDSRTPRPFAQGIPEVRNFPLALWEKLERQVLRECGTDVLLPGDPQGAEPLRKAIANYVNLERGARADASQIVITTSSQQALWLCATILFDQGDYVFVENPGYHGAKKAFDAAGLKSIPIPVDENGLRVDKMIGHNINAKAVALTPSHQFPTGAKLSLDRRLALIEWAKNSNSWLIEDDYDSEFHYFGKPTACVQGLDPNNRTIYIGTFTKSVFPSLRIGYLILPPILVRPMTVARTVLDGYNAQIVQLTLAHFIQGGHFGAYIRSMRAVYATRQKNLVKLINKHLSRFVSLEIPVGGLQMPLKLTRHLSERAVVDSAMSIGIDLLGMSDLDMVGDVHPGFLMGFAAFTEKEMEEGIKKLAKKFQSLDY